MANFYAKLKEMFGDCDVSYIEPLSYMKLFSSHQHLDAAKSKTILFYKRVSIYQLNKRKFNRFHIFVIHLFKKNINAINRVNHRRKHKSNQSPYTTTLPIPISSI